LTDAQHSGNVVSWIASAGATSYSVARAAYTSVPVGLVPPPVMQRGFLLEDQLPDPVPAGTPGSQLFNLPIAENLTPVGSTSSDFFVDRTAQPGKRYVYKVVAHGTGGYESPQSSAQVAPEPW